MFITSVGIPAGYGYFEQTATPQENIVPALKKHLKTFDKNLDVYPLKLATVAIQVKSDSKVSINGRAPILVQADVGLTFDTRGIDSITFDSAVEFNITVSY